MSLSIKPKNEAPAKAIDTVFRHATGGFVAVRSFADDGTTKAFRLSCSPVSERAFLLDIAEDDARRAAQDPKPIVFCPPVCTFHTKDNASEKNIAEAFVSQGGAGQSPTAGARETHRGAWHRDLGDKERWPLEERWCL
jgi:hypothetical protein